MKHETNFVAQLPKITVGSFSAGFRKRGGAKLFKNPGFLLTVILPTLCTAIYYALIASPIYLSTAEFVVKDSNQNSSLSGLGQFLTSAGLATSTNDAYAVASYITSRDALKQLEKTAHIRSMYSRPGADFVARFPNFYTLYTESFEWLYWHFCWWVEADFNTSTNITTISAWAFRPDDARTIAQQLLVLSEDAVNRMNDKARLDALRAAQAEVNELQQRAVSVQNQITKFRDTEFMLNPNQLSSEAETLRMTLESALVSARALLAQLQQTAPASPQIPGLKQRIKALESQVWDQNHKNSGGKDTLAPRMSKYDYLTLQQQFLQQMLQTAVSGLESAEISAIQQTLYVQRLTEPNTPDSELYAYRFVNTLLVFITTLLVYGTVRLSCATVREHLS